MSGGYQSEVTEVPYATTDWGPWNRETMETHGFDPHGALFPRFGQKRGKQRGESRDGREDGEGIGGVSRGETEDPEGTIPLFPVTFVSFGGEWEWGRGQGGRCSAFGGGGGSTFFFFFP